MTDKGSPIVRSYANNFFKYFAALNILTRIYVHATMAGKGFLLSPRCQSYLLQTTW